MIKTKNIKKINTQLKNTPLGEKALKIADMTLRSLLPSSFNLLANGDSGSSWSYADDIAGAGSEYPDTRSDGWGYD